MAEIKKYNIMIVTIDHEINDVLEVLLKNLNYKVTVVKDAIYYNEGRLE